MKKSKRGLLTLAVMVMMLTALVLSGCGKKEESAEIRVGALKGPTTIGLLHLMDEAEKGNTQNSYTFTMATAADELTAQVVKGDLDIALLPANVAAIVYQKTDGGVTVLDVNTLGVLYLVSGRDDITGVADLAGRTVYLTGKGTTPDYCLQYLLAQNGLSLEDVTLEYKSEATEVAAVLSENPDAVGLLPQPFVTVASWAMPFHTERSPVSFQYIYVSDDFVPAPSACMILQYSESPPSTSGIILQKACGNIPLSIFFMALCTSSFALQPRRNTLYEER